MAVAGTVRIALSQYPTEFDIVRGQHDAVALAVMLAYTEDFCHRVN